MILHDQSHNPLYKLSSISQLSSLLDVKEGQLLFVCYKRIDIEKYKTFYIPKKNGNKRRIDSPVAGLKLIQERLKNLLCSHISFKNNVQGFVRDRGICTNADFHKRSRWVLNVDIKDFFENINFGRVRGLFLAKPFEMDPKVAAVIAQICTFQNRLPQGSPTSPVISNMIGCMLDNKILQSIKKQHLIYTRYVDDITISSKRIFPNEIAYTDNGLTIIGERLLGLFSKSGFDINHKKSRLQLNNTRQSVTGVVVNKKVNIPSEYKYNLRAAIKQWSDNPQEAERKYFVEILKKQDIIPTPTGERLRNHIYGRLSFMKMVKHIDDPTYIKFLLKMIKNDPTPPRFAVEIKRKYQMYDVFLCHASEDKESIVIPLYEALIKKGLAAFYDSAEIQWGDSLPDKIGHALVQSKYVIAVLTGNSVEKTWPRKEINAVLTAEINSEKKRLLPLVYGNKKDILNSYYLINDTAYEEWKNNPDEIADKLLRLINSNTAGSL